jgi:hypothetical protein
MLTVESEEFFRFYDLFQVGDGGSLVFVRLVPVKIPIPIRIMTPTAIQVVGTPTRKAATARPMIRTTNPIR